MKTVIKTYVFLVITLNNCLFSQTLSLDQIEESIVYIWDEKINEIQLDGKKYELYIQEKGSKDKRPFTKITSGTGFLMRTLDKYLLVTVAHVAKSLSADTKITIKGKKGLAAKFRLSDFSNKEFKDTWIISKDSDVAIFPMTQLENVVNENFFKRFLNLNILVKDLNAPDKDILLLISGFPLNLGVGKYFSPLTMRSKASSGLISDKKNSMHFFVLENPSVQGYSGAPVMDLGYSSFGASGTVMVSNYGPTKCYGLISATLKDNTVGKLAVVVSAYHIFELIKSVP